MDVIKEGARSVGDIGGVHAPARESPQEKGVDRSEGQLAALGAGTGSEHVIENPGDLGSGEVGIEQESRPAPHQFLGALRLEPRALLRSAPVLPDDGAMDRGAARAVPENDRLAL